MTPAPTHADRFSGSMSTALSEVVEITIPPSVGLAPAVSPVPAPLATTGASWASASLTISATSSVVRGNTTPLGMPTDQRGGILGVEIELHRLMEHPVCAQKLFEIRDQGHRRNDRWADSGGP